MERRALLAAILSIGVIFLWQYLFMPLPPSPEADPARSSIVQDDSELSGKPQVPGPDSGTLMPSKPDSDGPSTSASSGTLLSGSVVVQEPTPTPIPEPELVEEHLKDPKFEAVFTSEGGGIKHIWLADYTPFVTLLGPVDRFLSLIGIRNKPEVAHEPHMDLFGKSRENYLEFELPGLLSPASRFKVAEKDSDSIRFERNDGSLRISKHYQLMPGDHMLRLEVSLENRGAAVVKTSPALTIYGQHLDADTLSSSGYAPNPSPIYLVDGEVEHLTASDLEDGPLTVGGRVDWAGVSDSYFLRAIMLPEPTAGSVTMQHVEDVTFSVKLTQGEIALEPGKSQVLNYQVFLGPKRSELLAQYNRNLQKSLNFGFFGVFAEPLLWLLKALYSLVLSYGLAIILLTIIIKTLFYPLFVKQIESAQRMKEFQPEMNAIKERFKEDKNRQNQEMMRFMQDNRINPLGGCLPMVLQMPIWFALYQVLQNAIELYHTSFLYLPDLSAADPYGISPFVLGGLMFLQQKMTPTPPGMDPMQAKMMQFLPLIFAGIMFTLPSGLVVYILINTLLTILQQWYITRRAERRSAQLRAGAPTKG